MGALRQALGQAKGQLLNLLVGALAAMQLVRLELSPRNRVTHEERVALGERIRDVRQGPGSLPVTEQLNLRVYNIPWFKFHRPAIIAEHATAFRKVAENYRELLPGDPGDGPTAGGWGLFSRR